MSKHSNGKVSRRDALKTFSVAAGAAAVPPWMAGCGEDAVSPGPQAKPRTGELVREEVPIDTVVCVMMENRSFDHYFGALSLEEGRTEVNGLTADMFNLDLEGNKIYPRRAGELCVFENPPYGFAHGPSQLDGGTNGGFVRAHMNNAGLYRTDAVRRPETVMEYHTREHLPFLYHMADDFALCQRWHCSLMTSTFPNRWYLHGAQSGGNTTNDLSAIFDGTNDFDLIYDRLAEKGLTFKYYYTDLPLLAMSLPFVGKFGRAHMRPIREFYEDAAAGTLPNYAMCDPGFNLNDDHAPHHLSLGQQFLSSLYHHLAQGPQWERSLMFITYDENGGFFDHVVPPKAPDAYAEQGLDQLGFRVPGIVAGPWVKNMVSDTLYEHTSVLAFLEWLYDMEPLTVRDAAANNFVDVLDAERIRANDPRPAPLYPEVEVLDEHMVSACNYFTADSSRRLTDLQFAADMGIIDAEYDLRPYRLQTLREIQAMERKRFLTSG